jgi:hypothetical protein
MSGEQGSSSAEGRIPSLQPARIAGGGEGLTVFIAGFHRVDFGRSDSASSQVDSPRSRRTAKFQEPVHAAFLEAGAPVVFVPGVMTRDEIEVLVGELGPNKTSLIAVPGVTPPTRELEEIGVARV